MSEQCCESFAANYEVSALPAMRAIERAVLGCDYGGTSWTTVAQAKAAAASLGLGRGARLLDLGSGSGWPGLYLTGQSECDTTLVDMPLNALRQAKARAAADQLGHRVTVVAGSGEALPFASRCFDAINHSDVLCCLPGKQRMLDECRRVVSAGKPMFFNVIRVADGLCAGDYERAVEAGPMFIAAPASYPEMLDRAGWVVEERREVTSEHRESLLRLIDGLSDSEDLRQTLGASKVTEEIDRRRLQVSVINEGLMVRESYFCRAGKGL